MSLMSWVANADIAKRNMLVSAISRSSTASPDAPSCNFRMFSFVLDQGRLMPSFVPSTRTSLGSGSRGYQPQALFAHLGFLGACSSPGLATCVLSASDGGEALISPLDFIQKVCCSCLLQLHLEV